MILEVRGVPLRYPGTLTSEDGTDKGEVVVEDLDSLHVCSFSCWRYSRLACVRVRVERMTRVFRRVPAVMYMNDAG
jgi:hypothetical protein